MDLGASRSSREYPGEDQGIRDKVIGSVIEGDYPKERVMRDAGHLKGNI